METFQYIAAMRGRVQAWRRAEKTIGLVPTMGNLHEGHFSLVADARREADRIVASIFVNPAQFGPEEDFASYPRTLEKDLARLRECGVDAVFAPSVDEMYPEGGALRTRIDVPVITGILCGASRPGHFAGVATVVNKLFNIVTPDLAVFGRKDYQQFLVIERMTRDLDLPVRLVGSVIVREDDGVAMSSRNAYLTPGERRRAPEIHRQLSGAAARLRDGDREYAAIEGAAWSALEAAGLEPEYFHIADPEDLGAAPTDAGRVVILAAARVGRARLIDNVEVALNAPGRRGDTRPHARTH